MGWLRRIRLLRAEARLADLEERLIREPLEWRRGIIRHRIEKTEAKIAKLTMADIGDHDENVDF